MTGEFGLCLYLYYSQANELIDRTVRSTLVVVVM